MKKKILGKRHVRERNPEMFSSLQDTNEEIISLIMDHLTAIVENLETYFQLLNTE